MSANACTPILWGIQGALKCAPQKFGVSAIVFGSLPMTPPVYFTISGVTKNSTGAVLGNCAVKLFRTADDVMVDSVSSDASTGAYAFRTPGPAENYYAVAYIASNPDVAGTTMNTLVGA